MRLPVFPSFASWLTPSFRRPLNPVLGEYVSPKTSPSTPSPTNTRITQTLLRVLARQRRTRPYQPRGRTSLAPPSHHRALHIKPEQRTRTTGTQRPEDEFQRGVDHREANRTQRVDGEEPQDRGGCGSVFDHVAQVEDRWVVVWESVY